MDRVSEMKQKTGSLNVNDACFLVHFIQEHAKPLLTLHSAKSAPDKDCKNLPEQVHKPLEFHSTASRHHLQKELTCKRVSQQKSYHQPSGEIDLTSLEEFPLISVQDKR